MQEVAKPILQSAVVAERPLLHPVIKLYWIVWAIAISLGLIIPVTASSGSWFSAGCISIGYVICTSIVAVSFGAKAERINKHQNRSFLSSSQVEVLRKVIVWTTVIGLLGVACMYYDRVYYQGVDYAESLATARNQMRMAAEVRQGFSSMFSVLGNLLWAVAYVPLALILLRWEMFKIRMAWFVTALNMLTVWAISALNGGRSPILLALGIAMAVISIRKALGMRGLPKLSKKMRIYAWVGGVLVALYSPYVLIQRARAVNVEFRFYTVESIQYLHGKTTEGFAVIDQLADAVGSFVYLYLMNLCHLVHQFWVFEDVIGKSDRQGSIIFGQVIYYLQKLSLFTNVSTDWDYSGVFLPLPGAVYYDFGFPGLIIVSVLHGFALGKASKILSRDSVSSRDLAWIVIVLAITFLSPFVAVFLMGPFTFMVAAYILILIIRKVTV